MYKCFLFLLTTLILSGFTDCSCGGGEFVFDGETKVKTPDQHDMFFPTSKGGHRFLTCENCHADCPSFSQSVCTDCHTHDPTKLQSVHTGVEGFRLEKEPKCEDKICLKCHANGLVNGSGLDRKTHSVNNYPIDSNSTHGEVTCSECHGKCQDSKSFICTDCHRPNSQYPNGQPHGGTHLNQVHKTLTKYNLFRYEGTPSKCEDKICITCHSKDGLNFSRDRHTPIFPLGIFTKHNQRNVPRCEDCHNQGTYKKFSCIDCHEHSKSRMDRKHQGKVKKNVYDSSACFDCHPKGRE